MNGGTPETTDQTTGHVIAVRGAVVDLDFRCASLPPIDDVVAIECEASAPIIAEVQAHLDQGAVRASPCDRHQAWDAAPWQNGSAAR